MIRVELTDNGVIFHCDNWLELKQWERSQPLQTLKEQEISLLEELASRGIIDGVSHDFYLTDAVVFYYRGKMYYDALYMRRDWVGNMYMSKPARFDHVLP